MVARIEARQDGFCCGKKMTEFEAYKNGTDEKILVCLECGYYEQNVTGQLDEEELEFYKENHIEGK